jgi:hypothetical protein
MYDGYGRILTAKWPEMERSLELVDDTLAVDRWLLEINHRKST